jgi:CubicO group peptidase (beta-lactamase class C family)
MMPLIMKFLRPLLFTALLLAMMSCHVGRFFYYNFADIKDYKKFPALPVENGGETFYFDKTNQPVFPALPEDFQTKKKNYSFDQFLEKKKTVAFLIIRNDTILYERYFSGYADSSVIPSFSVSKSFTSALTGIAINEGYIENADQSITDFIPELLENDPAFEKIRLEDLLNMRSGIKFNEGYTNPFADIAKYYYGKNLKKYITKLKIEEPPDQSYNYISVNTLLLGMAVERATGRQINQYLSEKIWIPLGMEYDASWNVDSKKDNQVKMFCCINAHAYDFAKFGRLYLNKGNWNGRQIVPREWVEKSMTIINDSRDSQNYPYTYQWRVKEDGAIFAKGVLGQYIYVDPAKNVIMVRLGKKSKGVHWARLMEEICEGL